jgi:hypothetical protein
MGSRASGALAYLLSFSLFFLFLIQQHQRQPEDAASAWWDPAAPQLSEHYAKSGLPDTVVNRLKWALQHTLGCPSTFEYRRTELRELLRTESVDDDTVLKSFLDSARDGIYYRYLRAAQIAYVHGDTLFVHGAADKRGLQFVPALTTRFLPNKEVHGTHVEELHEWVAKINDFAQRAIDDWRARPTWVGGDRGGEALMAYQNKPAILNKTVAVHSYVDGLNIALPGGSREGFNERSDPYDQEVCLSLVIHL